nr:hypothetical protein BaRGS_019849 [Batillaria attramentaria]
MLIKSLDKDDQKLMKAAEKDDGAPAIVDKKKYDVFISYAHRTPVEANRVHQALLDIDPDLRIFFDKSELTTGNIWQETLYEAVDKARCVIAFITESYLQSTVCQEEYNIALARFMSSETTLSVQPPKLQLLDSADMVVVFVSDEYLTSIQHRHELHIALCRQRMTKDRPVVYLIQANHIKPQPVYPHLLHHSINLGDRMWQTMSLRIPREQDPVLVKMPGGADTLTIYCYREEKQALTTAAMDIVAKLEDGPGPEGSGMPTNIVNLEHLIQHLVNKGVVTNVPVEKVN